MTQIPLTPSLDRYRACLLAGAIGDALGAPVEFLTRREILRDFGPEGIRDHAPAYGRVAAITDDTQMTLFTAEGLLRARGHALAEASGDTAVVALPPVREQCVASVAQSYLQWLLTQRELPGVHAHVDGLLGVAALHSRRAPGHTCLSALERLEHMPESTRVLQANNGSKGCGGVMRVAPAGLFCAARALPEPELVRESFGLGADLARITHGHPGGYLPGGVLAALVALLVREVPLHIALARAREVLVTFDGHEETLQAITAAERLAAQGPAQHDAMVSLGGGWVGEEALAMALYCALAAESPESALVVAVNHSGDSDSTGAIAGNLMGAQHGSGWIPARWLDGLELRGVIDAAATALAKAD
jgi:ADP-ribosyl-[dinitrogen reductase] hydrolase